MDKLTHQAIVDQQIEQAINAMFPYGEGRASRAAVEHHLKTVGQVGFREGRSYALHNILTTDEALEEINQRLRADDRKPISRRRLLAIAKYEHDRFAVGRQISRGTWLFAREEIDNLMPVESGHRRAK